METILTLTEAYLRVNGYFTITGFPLLEASREGKPVPMPPVLAYRFACPERRPGSGTPAPSPELRSRDPQLGGDRTAADLLLVDVRNRPAGEAGGLEAEAVAAVLTRFGCCAPAQAAEIVDRLLRYGRTYMPGGYRARVVAVGTQASLPGQYPPVITLNHLLRFLRAYVRTHHAVLAKAEFRDPVLGILARGENLVLGALGTQHRKP